jgi:hypothetical protein
MSSKTKIILIKIITFVVLLILNITGISMIQNVSFIKATFSLSNGIFIVSYLLNFRSVNKALSEFIYLSLDKSKTITESKKSNCASKVLKKSCWLFMYVLIIFVCGLISKFLDVHLLGDIINYSKFSSLPHKIMVWVDQIGEALASMILTVLLRWVIFKWFINNDINLKVKQFFFAWMLLSFVKTETFEKWLNSNLFDDTE